MKKKEEIKCPSCGSSEEVSNPQISAQAFAIGILLLGVPIPFISRTYHCFNCRLDFKNKKN